MQSFSQKYAVMQLLEDIPEGHEFGADEWPLHVTIVDVFAIDWTSEEMVKKLESFSESYSQIKISSIAQGDVFFGKEKQVRVTLLEKTSALEKLHCDIMSLLRLGNLQLNNPEFAGDGFRPHATVQDHVRLQKGDTVQFTSLTIIDMFPNEDPYMRKVLGSVELR